MPTMKIMRSGDGGGWGPLDSCCRLFLKGFIDPLRWSQFWGPVVGLTYLAAPFDSLQCDLWKTKISKRYRDRLPMRVKVLSVTRAEYIWRWYLLLAHLQQSAMTPPSSYSTSFDKSGRHKMTCTYLSKFGINALTNNYL